MSGELKRSKEGGTAEVSGLRASLEDAEKRLAEVAKLHATEVKRLDDSATHALSLEKAATVKALAETTSRLNEAVLSSAAATKQLAEARSGASEAAARAEGAEKALGRLREQQASDRIRLRESEAEIKDASRRAASWKDERSALQSELHAERRHVELERKHKEALEHSLTTERSVNKSIQVRLTLSLALSLSPTLSHSPTLSPTLPPTLSLSLPLTLSLSRSLSQVLLESRLGELASNQGSAELAAGAEALQVLMGRANASQAALEAREIVLSDAFSLLTTRHNDRVGAIERAAEQRERWGGAADKLESALGRVGEGGGDAGVLSNELKQLRGLLQSLPAAAGASVGLTTETLAKQEAALSQAIAKFATRNNALHEQLQQAHEQLAELQRLLGGKHGRPGAPGGAAQQHRTAPPSPPMPAGASAAAAAARREAAQTASAKFDSAEYKASAPPPARPPPRKPVR